ncbi:MAG: T9SS type A sorting domain-containing protein [Bacteroidetes bacterium]|nr:T9SS type A sorting domain-containing protein [Bacteroidota bacterium]
MKNCVLTALLSVFIGPAMFAQCTLNFSHSANWDTLSFTNLSSVPNAHYYWNFGDGSTSYQDSPVHVFPASGQFLVTLYGRDTLGNCHAYHEEWINVTELSSDPCQPGLVDSLLTYQDDHYIAIDEASVGCNGYWPNIDAGPAQNFSPGNWIWLGDDWIGALWVDRIQYSTNDSINGSVLRKEYYHTLPFYYDRNVNYDSCSANFEFHAEYQTDGALVSFRAMNPAGVDSFYVIGFGNPIIFASSSGSHLYPYVSYEPHFPWLIYHKNTQGGCSSVCTQTLMIQNPGYVTPLPCTILTQPSNQVVSVGNDVQIIIESGPGTTKQWQQNAGLGWQDLYNAGPYSGVETDTLTVANCQSWWSGYQFRCVVTVPDNNCHNTSGSALINVTVGMKELTDAHVQIYPNPASNLLNLTWPEELAIRRLIIQNAHGQDVAALLLNSAFASVDISQLPSGLYSLTLESDQRVVRGRFLKL